VYGCVWVKMCVFVRMYVVICVSEDVCEDVDFTSTLPLCVSSSSARMGFLAGLGTMGTRITLSLGDKGIGVRHVTIRQTGPSSIT